MDSFALQFKALTGHAPFPWQEAFFARLLDGEFPEVCAIPTGIGKTSVIAVWLLALARRGEEGSLLGFPRRLVYVVNRRTVVDQATIDVETWRQRVNTEPALGAVQNVLRRLAVLSDNDAFAVSTLRGQRADNAEWRLDPARPAVVIGTIDMIGSRLLFGGYGCGFRSKPLHAGFLGQDAWLVHDEAHLEPAFQRLLIGIRYEQKMSGDVRPFIVTALTATSRDGHVDFQLTDNDRADEVVFARLHARKSIALHRVDPSRLVDGVVEHVVEHAEGGEPILVYLRTVEDVEKVCERLGKAGLTVEQLTGTLRGFERDRFVRESRVFRRFAVDDSAVDAASGTVCLVCTSAGEVGVNISANHMVCDLTPFDSMAQRLGRVNRFGGGDARVDVLVAGLPMLPDADSDDAYTIARARTALLLTELPLIPTTDDGVRRHDASPGALEALPLDARRGAFSPSPVTLPTSDFLFDAWALTSVPDRLPGRPRLEEWLHGVAPWDPPETTIAWRTEVEKVTGQLLEAYAPEDLLDDYPLKPHEFLRDRSDRVFAHVKDIAAREPNKPVWVVGDDGFVSVRTLKALAEGGRTAIEHSTLLLPPSAGGLAVDRSGLPTGRLAGQVSRQNAAPGASYDVADLWLDESGQSRRQRVWNDEIAPAGMRLVRSLRIERASAESGDEADIEVWRWYTSPAYADNQESHTALRAQPLHEHHLLAETLAAAFAARLGLDETEAVALRSAARLHDLGKARAVWQRSIRNMRYPEVVLAKSGNTLVPRKLSSYRHELGSLIDIRRTSDFQGLSPIAQDLVMHLVAAHHGRGRPAFRTPEVHDPERQEEEAASAVRDAMVRYGRLQRRYGRWGLAFLESLLRAADSLASNPDLTVSLAGHQPVQAQPGSASTPRAPAMQASVSTFDISADPLNPGEFLACCGLFELADRLGRGAEAWFDRRVFRLRTDVQLSDVVYALIGGQADELTRPNGGLAVAPLIAPLVLKLTEEPRGAIVLDGWMAVRIQKGKVIAVANRPWNFWSGQQTTLRIWRALRAALQQQVADTADLLGDDLFARRVALSGRFGFDPGAAWTALDVGFSPNEQKIAVASSPAVELLAAVGLQRFRPIVADDRETFYYSTWATPLSPCVAAAACTGLLPSGGRSYRGTVISRGSYAALSTSIPFERTSP